MSLNSSSTNSSFSIYGCVDVGETLYIAIAYSVTKVLLVSPLCVFILHLGHQRWRRQRFARTTSHSDYFTFHMAAMELLSELGWSLLCYGAFTRFTKVAAVGLNVFFIVFPGQTLFHVLICLERYLAVVRPIAYRGLKQSAGARVRTVCSGCVWLFCAGWCTSTYLFFSAVSILFFCVFIFSLVVVTYCSVSVLCVLIRPGPGDVAKDRERVDQFKLRAFYTVMSIMGGLWLLFIGILVCVGLTVFSLLSYDTWCVVVLSTMWFNVPGSFVLLLLFLHRAGKLHPCTSRNK